MTLRIGPYAFDVPVVLAPMAGVTNPAFRALCWSFGPALMVSEMVSARAAVEQNPKTLRMLRRAPGEAVHSVQLYGTDPAIAAEATRRLVGDHGVEHVDLNFGCPMAKVTRKGGGAALLARPRLFGDLVGATVAAAGDVPVTVKMRLGIDEEHLTYLDSGRIAEAHGAAAVALHARTAADLYGPPARWEHIGELVATVTSIPVLGNGDVWEAGDALAMQAETGCAGVVIGRGCLGRPWLFRDLADLYRGRPAQPAPRLGDAAATLRRHAELLVDHLGEPTGVRDLRKHVHWYLQGYAIGGELRHRLAMVSSLAELDGLLGDLDPDRALPPAAARLRRGHTRGPQQVALPAGWLDAGADERLPRPLEGADLAVSGG